MARGTTVIDPRGNVPASLEVNPRRAPSEDYLAIAFVGWGDRSHELRVELYAVTSARSWPDYQIPRLAPVIEHPPVDDPPRVEVVVDTCLNLREEPSLDAPILACLPNGAVVERDDFQTSWFHLRTDDGLEGWASAEYLRWYSDGVRLEE